MANFNRVFLMGNLTADPEVRYTPSGAAVANLRLAVNHVYNNREGERVEEASFFTVVAWGRQAEICGEYLKKGRPVFVEGRLRSRSWENQEGQKRYAVEVMANRIQFLGGRPDETTALAEDLAGDESVEPAIAEDVPF